MEGKGKGRGGKGNENVATRKKEKETCFCRQILLYLVFNTAKYGISFLRDIYAVHLRHRVYIMCLLSGS